MSVFGPANTMVFYDINEKAQKICIYALFKTLEFFQIQ